MSPALFDLAEPRTILLTDRNRVFTLHCRRITNADWTAYFAGIVVTSEQDGKSRISVVDVNTPRLALAEAVLTGAEGYSVAGGAELTSIDSWRKKIPLAHRLRLGETLADVRPSSGGDADPFTIYPESEVVSLDASYTAAIDHDSITGRTSSSMQRIDSITGRTSLSMQRIEGLQHFLNTPTEEQHRRYTREASRSRVVGGSRSGKTIYQGAQLLLAKLYDELVVSVDGYAVDGAPLTTDRSAIVREMDLLHKVMAAQELFQPSESVQLASGDSGDGEDAR